jgi:hypothetical protein
MEKLVIGYKNPITAYDASMHEVSAIPRLREDDIYLIKKILLTH